MSYQIIRTGADNHGELSPNSDSKKIEFSSSRVSNAPSKISKIQLINKINYLNFQDEPIIVNMRHNKYNHIVSLKANPEPCLGDELSCKWEDQTTVERILKNCSFDSIVIRDEDINFVMKLEPVKIDEQIIKFRLPSIYFPLVKDKITNNPCIGVDAKLLQNSVIFEGSLLACNYHTFSIHIFLNPPQTIHWINLKSTISLLLVKNNDVLFSGECKIVNEKSFGNSYILILSAKINSINRFQAKKFRSNRVKIDPAPNLFFVHPFTMAPHTFEVIDISGSGFSVRENGNNPSLFAGLILPQVELRLANNYKLKIRVQVVHQKISTNDKMGLSIKYGMVILDITSKDHLILLSFLQRYEGKNKYICNELDMNSLWKFLFDSGFVYPEKYQHVNKNKKSLKKIYETIYSQHTNIARHFTYQDNGNISGHLSMIRFYENTWLIHHHASTKSVSYKTGLIVLNQIGQFSNNAHSLFSNHMNFLMCFFRPENKFPNRVFGGAARTINDKEKCSIESFIYLHHKKCGEIKAEIPINWSLTYSSPEDLDELEKFYYFISGGLLLKAADIQKNKLKSNEFELSNEFNKIGLLRKRFVFSLKKDDDLVAIILINLSDFGLNLSDLTRGAKVIVLDQIKLQKEILSSILSFFSIKFQWKEFPVLIYPNTFALAQKIDFEKKYDLWILDTRYGDHYFRYINRLTKLI